jgi:hypothetical protein
MKRHFSLQAASVATAIVLGGGAGQASAAFANFFESLNGLDPIRVQTNLIGGVITADNEFASILGAINTPAISSIPAQQGSWFFGVHEPWRVGNVQSNAVLLKFGPVQIGNSGPYQNVDIRFVSGEINVSLFSAQNPNYPLLISIEEDGTLQTFPNLPMLGALSIGVQSTPPPWLNVARMVPEPASYALLLAGLVGVLGVAKRRSQGRTQAVSGCTLSTS